MGTRGIGKGLALIWLAREIGESQEDEEEEARQRRSVGRVSVGAGGGGGGKRREGNQGGGPRSTREGGTRPAADTHPTQDPGRPQEEPRLGGREEGHHRTLEAFTRQARAHTHTHTHTHTTTHTTHTHQSADEDNLKTETVLGGIEPECHSSANPSAGG